MKPQSISTAKLFLIAISLLLFQYATAQNNCPLCKIPNADFVFNNNDILSNQTFMDFVIEINGTVYIDGSCEFYGCYIYLSEQARIELLPGPTELILRYNEFYDCCLPHYAWDGIYTTDQENYIFAGNNYFRHGENVFVEAFGAEVILNFNEFDRCYYPLTLQDWSGVPRIEFRGNYIQSILPITAQPAPPNNIPTNGKTPVGIRIINYVSTGSSLLTIGDATAYSNFNSFVEIFTAIESLNSDVRIINNKILYSEFGFLCINLSSPQHFRFIIGGTGTFEGNTLWDINEVGTHVYGNVELSIKNNLIDGGTRTGILLSNVDVNSTVAMIQYNEMHLGKHNAGSIPRNFKGIHIHGSTGSIDISFNFINTKTLNGIPLAIGEGIDVSSSGGSGNRIDIFSNIIENVRYGIRARILLSETELTIAANRIEFTTTADEYGEAGIFIFFCYQIIGEIINNFIENYISGIYGDFVYNTNVNHNEVEISALPIFTNSTVGIHWSHSHNNQFIGNEIKVTNGLNQNPNQLFNNKGIHLNNNANSIIAHNIIENTYRGLYLENIVLPSWIYCNIFDYNAFGVTLDNAVIGVDDGIHRNIGWINTPSDNEWHNELFPPLRLVGVYNPNVSGARIMWYYKSGTPFELYTSQWLVPNNPPWNPNFDSQLTPDSVNLCSQFQSFISSNTLSKMTELQLLSLSSSALDSLMVAEFSHLDSLLVASPFVSSYSLPTDIRLYGIVKISYDLLLRLPTTFSSVSTVANRIDSIRSFLSNTNIHKLFVLDTLADSRNTNQLITELGNLIPQNQLETNAVLFYATYANFLNNNLTLTGSDSVALHQIAHQHPANGGYPVYKARDLLGLYIFDSITLPGTPSASQMKYSLSNEFAVTEVPEIHIFPNPSRELIYIKTSGIAGNNSAYIELFSSTGIRVNNARLNINDITTISTDELNNGMYYYRVIFNNSRVKTGKLVIQK